MSSEITARLWSWSVHTGDSLFAEAASEIIRLRALITAWADAEVADGFHDEPDCDCGAPLCAASTALRKAVGR